MKVLHLVTAFPRNETDIITPWLWEILKGLKQKGIDIEIFAPSYKGLGNQKIFGLKVHRFRYFFKRWEYLTHEETTPDRFQRSIFYKFLSLFYILGGIIGMVKLMQRERYDIVQAHWPFPHTIFGYFAKRIGGAKLISTFYGVELRWIKAQLPFFLPLIRWIIRKSDCLTAISSYTAKEIKDILAREVAIIPYTSTILRDEAKEVTSEKDSKKRILFVGRLVERKGVEYLIDAFNLIAGKIEAKLIIVGEGPERHRLEELVKSYGLKERVVFKGRICQEELERCYANCDVFVLPAIVDSKGDTEGLGVVLLEAMSYKKPVIASNLGGIVDIVRDGESGILVPEKNPQKLAEAILKILEDKDYARRLGEKGYRFAKENFSLERIVRRWLELYRRLSQ
ncbi:MAG: glycosyltransferase family 4 protein [Candidatus Edwardsbacteria bacterium]